MSDREEYIAYVISVCFYQRIETKMVDYFDIWIYVKEDTK